VLPDGFHRIRHYGLLANGGRADNIARARRLLDMTAIHGDASDARDADDDEPQMLSYPCPCCGGAWSSSRPSSAAARRDIIPPARSGSTAHECPVAPSE
jgi:hypothetical protein